MKKIYHLVFVLALSLALPLHSDGYDKEEHVSVSINAKGDMLIFPLYMAAEGWETEITVINVHETDAMVANIEIKEALRGANLLYGLNIFLAPSDIWTGTLFHGRDGLYLRSTDDSILNNDSLLPNSLVWASAEHPAEVNLEGLCSGDIESYGHVTVNQVVSFSGSGVTFTKDRIADIYHAWLGEEFNLVSSPTTVYSGGQTISVNLPQNQMMGNAHIRNTINGLNFIVPPTVLFNYDRDQDYLRQTGSSGNATIGDEAKNSLAEVDATLSKNYIVIPSVKDAYLFQLYLFPTKGANFPCGVDNWLSPYEGFPTVPSEYDCYASSGELLSSGVSNSLPYSLNIVPVGALSGRWIMDMMDHGPTTGSTLSCPYCDDLQYTGAPVIAGGIYITGNGISFLYSAHELGRVYINGEYQRHYHNFEMHDN